MIFFPGPPLDPPMDLTHITLVLCTYRDKFISPLSQL